VVDVTTGDVPRGVGWLLVCGAVVFWIGAVTPPYRQWMGVPLEEYLTIVGNHRPNWYVMHGLFAAGTVLTMAGLVGLGDALRASGDRAWSAIAGALFCIAATLWLVQVGFRVTATPWAFEELARTGQVPSVYPALHRWTGILFGGFMVMAYLAIAAYGLAILKTSAIGRWAGWTAVAFGLIAVPGLVTPVFQPPLMIFVAPFVVGIAVLRA
jgi:hypothetical protein